MSTSKIGRDPRPEMELTQLFGKNCLRWTKVREFQSTAWFDDSLVCPQCEQLTREFHGLEIRWLLGGAQTRLVMCAGCWRFFKDQNQVRFYQQVSLLILLGVFGFGLTQLGGLGA